MIPTLGIVGGIGSGKSAVADAMRSLGGHLIAADRLGHEALLQPDIKAKLRARWGDAIFDARGDADRKKIGAIVFADPVELRALEAQVFPYIEMRIIQEIADARNRDDVKFIILDAAILLETGWHRHCDKIVFVDAPRPLRLARLKEKRGWDDAELDRREKMQMPLEEKMNRADAVIVNDGDLEKVGRQVKETLVRWKVIC
jgi:dephospho-CoA kinase